MADFINTAQNNLTYIGYGALGGYGGAFIQSKYVGMEGLSFTSRYLIESAVAGGVFNYIWLLLMTNPDTDTIWKGLLVGWLGEFLYNKFVKGMLTSMNIVS